MKGLILKDTLYIVKQKKLLAMYALCAVMLSFAMDSTFIVSYFSMIGAILVINTITYDSFENGFAFLMCLPTSPKKYTQAKYLFSLLGISAVWIISVILQFVSLTIRKAPINTFELLSSDLICFAVFMVICGIMIPISLKYGSEKGRIVLIIVAGICCVVVVAVTKFLTPAFSDDIEAFVTKMSLSQIMISLICLFAGLTIFFLSLPFSISIMKKKEF